MCAVRSQRTKSGIGSSFLVELIWNEDLGTVKFSIEVAHNSYCQLIDGLANLNLLKYVNRWPFHIAPRTVVSVALVAHLSYTYTDDTAGSITSERQCRSDSKDQNLG